MPKFTVVGLIDATVAEDVEAESAEAAQDAAALSASLCHQCARELEVDFKVGDVVMVEHKYSHIPSRQATVARTTSTLAILRDGSKYRHSAGYWREVGNPSQRTIRPATAADMAMAKRHKLIYEITRLVGDGKLDRVPDEELLAMHRSLSSKDAT